jgi:uncharacterized membrane protein YczE
VVNPRPATPSTRAGLAGRVARCVAGLALFGAGIALILQADLGAAPWDMLHKGISEHIGVSIGVVVEAVGFLLLLGWIPLRQRPGIGTILNAIEIGLVMDLVGHLLPDVDRLAARFALLVLGIAVVAVGSGLYIGAGLGSGPRDGLMVGLSERFGWSIRAARTGIETSVGVGGVLLGVAPGIGTFVFMFGIGPLVQLTLPWFTVAADRVHGPESGRMRPRSTPWSRRGRARGHAGAESAPMPDDVR